MDIETSNAVRLFFPSPSLTLVFYEAIANALDANASEVSICISIDAFDKPETLQITIVDNGDGFTDENFSRFKTLLKPRDKYHKGIGRLVFLNYFKSVEVDSRWEDKKRCFVFKDGFDGNSPVQAIKNRENNETILSFKMFEKDRVKAYEDLKPAAIKQHVLEHFLPTLNERKRNSVDFRISIKLTTNKSNEQKEFFTDEAFILPEDLPTLTKLNIDTSAIDFFSGIDLYYYVGEVSGKGNHLVAFSIDGRTVPANLISSTAFPIGYSCFFLFESDMFHSNANSSRQKLVLPDNVSETHFNRVLRRYVGQVLTQEVPVIVSENTKTKDRFEEKYPHLLGYFEEDTVGLIDREDALSIAQNRFFQVQKKVLESESLSDSLYEESIDLSSRALTEYILYREKIIKRLQEITNDDSEADIHNLIVPRYKIIKKNDLESSLYQNNAWLLDEKFMSFRTILSEKRMDVVVEAIRLDEEKSDDLGRPDIAMIFSADPDDQEAVDVVVVEIKKKTDNEKENQYAVNQLLKRAYKLANHCPNIQRVWYYAVIQVDDNMARSLRQQNWVPIFSKGSVFYQEHKTERDDGSIVPTPTFVVSFDAIVADARCRNHTFLEILRDGIKKRVRGASSKNGEHKELNL